MSINQRIAELIKHYQLEQKEFAKKVGVTAATISKTIKGLSVPGGNLLVETLAQYPEISAEWLMRGKGEMLLNNSKLNQLEDTPPTITQTQYQNLLHKIDQLQQEVEELKKDEN